MSYSYLLHYDDEPEEGGLQAVMDALINLKCLEILELGSIPHDAYSLKIDTISTLTSLKTLSFDVSIF